MATSKRRRSDATNNQAGVNLASEHSQAAEAYRMLRTNIQFFNVDNPLRTIAVTSATPGEGKTTTTCNLAVSFARNGQRVLIIDADLRRPAVHKAFRLPNTSGVSTALVSTAREFDDFVQFSGIENLWVLTSGPVPPNPAEMVGSQRMKQMIEHFSDVYDLVIVDSPPMLAVADPVLLGMQVDGVVLTMRSGKVTKETAVHAVRSLIGGKCHLLGIVLNAVKRGGEGHQRYYYGD